MKKIFGTLAIACLLAAPIAGFAQDSMKQDSMSQDGSKQDSMKNDQMKPLFNCHPERSEGPWFQLRPSRLQSRTKVPRFARDDSALVSFVASESAHSNAEPITYPCSSFPALASFSS